VVQFPGSTIPQAQNTCWGVWYASAFAAFVDEAIEQRGHPNAEATRIRAFPYYEEALAEKNGRQPRSANTNEHRMLVEADVP
jgi:hypothetical protein